MDINSIRKAISEVSEGRNDKEKGIISEAFVAALSVFDSKDKFLRWAKQNNIDVYETVKAAMPYLQSGPLSSILNKYAPGIIPRLQAAGDEFIRQGGQERTGLPRGAAQPPAAGNKRIHYPLKRR